jgi:hypothetical protein
MTARPKGFKFNASYYPRTIPGNPKLTGTTKSDNDDVALISKSDLDKINTELRKKVKIK